MSIENVIGIMEQLAELYTLLLELGRSKKDIIIANDVEKLNQLVHKENKWVKQVAELEQKRVQAVGEYLISRGFYPNPDITVRDLVKIIFKAEEKKSLMEAQSKLVNILLSLKKVNELNQQLIQQSLNYIDFSIDLVTGAPSDDMVYTNPMQQRQQGMKRTGYFDTRA